MPDYASASTTPTGSPQRVAFEPIVVEVAPGVNIRMLRRAVMDVVQDGGVNGAASAPQLPKDE
jgi:hypothetical protein